VAGLLEVLIPPSVESIGERAFYGTSIATRALVPCGCEVGEDAFPSGFEEDCSTPGERARAEMRASLAPFRLARRLARWRRRGEVAADKGAEKDSAT